MESMMIGHQHLLYIVNLAAMTLGTATFFLLTVCSLFLWIVELCRYIRRRQDGQEAFDPNDDNNFFRPHAAFLCWHRFFSNGFLCWIVIHTFVYLVFFCCSFYLGLFFIEPKRRSAADMLFGIVFTQIINSCVFLPRRNAFCAFAKIPAEPNAALELLRAAAKASVLYPAPTGQRLADHVDGVAFTVKLEGEDIDGTPMEAITKRLLGSGSNTSIKQTEKVLSAWKEFFFGRKPFVVFDCTACTLRHPEQFRRDVQRLVVAADDDDDAALVDAFVLFPLLP